MLRVYFFNLNRQLFKSHTAPAVSMFWTYYWYLYWLIRTHSVAVNCPVWLQADQINKYKHCWLLHENYVGSDVCCQSACEDSLSSQLTDGWTQVGVDVDWTLEVCWSLNQSADIRREAGSTWTGHQSVTGLTHRDRKPFRLTLSSIFRVQAPKLQKPYLILILLALLFLFRFRW